MSDVLDINLPPLPSLPVEAGSYAATSNQLIGWFNQVRKWEEWATEGLYAEVREKLDSVQGTLAATLTTIDNETSQILASVSGIGSTIAGAIADAFAGLGSVFESLRDALEKAIDELGTSLSNIYDKLKDAVNDLGDKIGDAFTTAISTLISRVNALADRIFQGLTNVGNTIVGAVVDSYNVLRDALNRVGDVLATAFNQALDGLKTGLTAVWEGIKTTMSLLWEAVKDIGKALWSFVEDLIRGIREMLDELLDMDSPEFKERVKKMVLKQVEIFRELTEAIPGE